MESVVEIIDLRKRIDQLNEKLLGGISTRIKYSLNSGVFEEKFSENKSWFLYRLKREQDLDSEFGRFLYNDQLPFIFKKEELVKAKIGEPMNKGVTPIDADFSQKVIELYRELLKELCKNKIDDKGTFGETTKLDVENILTLNERTVGLGEQVAAFKLQTEPKLQKLSAQEIRENLIKPEREKEVIETTLKLAKKYGIENESVITTFTKKMISITLDAEVYFISNQKI